MMSMRRSSAISTSGQGCIVTTNYDLTRDGCREAFSIAPNIYRAPALPRGDDFEGIVHLHGCLGDKLTDLVLTSRDFGRAYLTEAWASRFLYDLFRKYATLFVGYSTTTSSCVPRARVEGRNSQARVLATTSTQ